MSVAMKGVQLFRAGRYPILNHRTKTLAYRTFTERDLDAIVSNFERHKDKFKPSVVKGHVPGSVYDPTIPRLGTPSRVYRDGKTLLCDADHVDDGLASEIKAKRYGDISAEIYESPEEAGLDGSGLMLRRIAVLGGDVPKVKGLNPEGLEKTLLFSDEKTGFTVLKFAEVDMGRDEMVEKLIAKGLPQDVCDGLDDVQMQAICTVFCKDDPTETPAAPPPPTPDSAPPMQFSEEVIAAIAEKIAAPIRQRLDATDKDSRRQRIHLFCEQELQAGRLDPAEFDTSGGPTIIDRLMTLDDTAKVFKFSEGGQDKEFTQLDAELRAIRNRPARFVNNGRKIGAAVLSFSECAVDRGEARVMRFAEDHADAIALVNGQTPDDYLKTYKSAKPEHKAEILRGLEEQGY